MARRKAESRVAPAGDYNVSGGNRGSFHLTDSSGNAQYLDGIASVQCTLVYRGDGLWKGTMCSVFKEDSRSVDGAESEPKYGWLFTGLQDAAGRQQSQVGFVALEDIPTLEDADVLSFGDAIYTAFGGTTSLDDLRRFLS
jgi:hypothetical protein